MYVDHLKKHICVIYGTKSPASKDLYAMLKRQDKESLAFQTMRELRNYAQHRDLPITLMRTPWKRPSPDAIGRITCTPALDLTRLAADKDFNPEVLEQLTSGLPADGAPIDLKPLVREAMSLLGEFHTGLRELVRADTDAWDRLFEQAVQGYWGTDDCEGDSVTFWTQGQDGKYEMISLFPELLERRKLLQGKNRFIQHYRNSHVSGEVETRQGTCKPDDAAKTNGAK
jgi:hypothetical protein